MSVLRSFSVGWVMQMPTLAGGEVVGFLSSYRDTLREL